MRIGFLTERMILGYGVDLATDRLAQGLSKLGFDVTVYCSLADGSFSGGKYDIRTVPLRGSVFVSEYESRAEELIRPLENEVDLWIVETYPFFKAAHGFKRPWIAIDYGVVPSKSFPLATRRRFDYIRRTQYGEYFQSASKIVCISEFLLRNLPLSIRRNAVLVYPGIDHYSRRSLIDLRVDLGLDGVVILYQGRSSDTTPYKGVDTLLGEYSKLRPELNANLVISTSCSLEEQTRLERAGAKVLNGVLMPFMPSVYQCADLFATATQWEGFDLPLLEASYFRLPVVAFSVGAHPEIVHDGETGYLVTNPAEFANKLTRLIENPDLRSKMGRKGADLAAEFTWDRAVRAFERIVREIGQKSSSTVGQVT